MKQNYMTPFYLNEKIIGVPVVKALALRCQVNPVQPANIKSQT